MKMPIDAFWPIVGLIVALGIGAIMSFKDD